MARRRWLQFSIRTVLLVTAAVGIGLAAFNGKAARQRQAVEAIRPHGGRVTYDWQDAAGWEDGSGLGGGDWGLMKPVTAVQASRKQSSAYEIRFCRIPTEADFPAATELGVPQWLRDWLGPHYFHDIVAVDLFGADDAVKVLPWLDDLPGLKRLDLGTGLTEADLAALPRLHRLERLEGFAFSDASLVYVKNLPMLRELDLRRHAVSDEGLQHLAGLTCLESLELADVPLTDAGLAHLAGLRSLRELSLRDSRITENGLASLGRLGNLQRLDLGETAVTGAYFHLLAPLPLEELSLDRTEISDDVLRHLAGMTTLRKLNLNYTSISDAGLVHLRNLKNLKWLHLGGTKVTREGVERLDAALPGYPIVR